MNRFIKNATVNSGREGRICERPKMIGWSLSQAGAPEMGISEEGASSLLHGTALTDNTLVTHTHKSEYVAHSTTRGTVSTHVSTGFPSPGEAVLTMGR